MTTLTWNLPVAPTQTPEYWLLFVDGNAWCAISNVTTYANGQFSCDLTQIDTPIPPGPHQLSLALVGGGAVGPQSPPIAVNIPITAVTVTTVQAPPPPVWPAAETLSYS
jgi:hypothetical protein